MIAIWGCFCGPEGVINSSCGNNVSLLDWGYPFQTVGGGGRGRWACGLCPKSRARRARTLPSEVYPAGFDFMHLPFGAGFRVREGGRVINGSCGSYGFLLAWG